MYLNDLASVIRASGMNVIEVSGWQSRNHGSLVNVQSIICHHTAGAATGNYPSLSVVTNGRTDLKGPLAHLGLGRDGTVYVISNGVAWHAGATINDAIWGNTHSIGIEAENTGSQPWPDVQVDAYAKLIAVLCKHYGLGIDRVKGHKEICAPAGRKPDPAGLPGDMDGLRGRVQVFLSGSTTTTGKLLNGESNMKLPVAMTTRTETLALPPDANVKLIFAAPTTIFGGHIYFWSAVNGQGTGGDPVGFRVEVRQGMPIKVPSGTTKADISYSCASEVDLYIQAIA
jgi:N-acetylmuramoyl-L-alanine amidase-like protein